MKKLLIILIISSNFYAAHAQSAKIELYDLLKKLFYDSTGYENVGDWAVGQQKKIPVQWKTDHIVMSDDTSINFYRMGTSNITINGRSFMQAGKPVKWNIMLKGPRMGYTSFSIISSPSAEIKVKYTIDSLFGKKAFRAKLIKSCDANAISGFYYYEVKLPKKDLAFLKLSWITVNGNTAIRIDCYDNWSKYAVKLNPCN